MPFVFDETDLDPRDGSVAGCKPERVRWTMKRGLAGAAVGKIEEKRKPEDFSGHRKRGAKHFKSPLLRQKKTYALIQSIGLFQRNKSLAGFVKYASRVKYCFAM